MFTLDDINTVRSRAISLFVSYPARCRLPGMTRDLTEDEKRTMAFYEASSILFANKPYVPRPYEKIIEPVEGEAVSYNSAK